MKSAVVWKLLRKMIKDTVILFTLESITVNMIENTIFFFKIILYPTYLLFTLLGKALPKLLGSKGVHHEIGNLKGNKSKQLDRYGSLSH